MDKSLLDKTNPHIHERAYCRSHSNAIGVVYVTCLILLVVQTQFATADPARFWISTSNISTPGPEAPSIVGVENSVRFLHIWAQPATIGPGSFNSATNPFKTLQNFSLNLVTANQPVVEFRDPSIVVHNPLLSGTKRFHFVHDASENLKSVTTLPDRINGIKGFNISDTVPYESGGIMYTGIGPSCHANDPYCYDGPTTPPAWLIASVAMSTIAPDGQADFFLEIGSSGISHEGDPNGTADTSVVFGTGSGPVYNALTNRGTHSLNGETADFVVQAVSQATSAQWTSGSGQWSDPSKWSTFSEPSWQNDAILNASPGNSVVTVTSARRANSTTVNSGRLDIGSGGSLASEVTVNDGGAISGQGWVGSNLQLAGSLVLNSTEPLMVAGTADITGGTLVVGPNYFLAPNSVSPPFAALTAVGGLQCGQASCSQVFDATVGQSLGPGHTLESISFTPQSVIVQVRSGILGDYSGDGTVDAADYVVWRNGGPLLNEGASPGTVDQADFEFWKSRFGITLGSSVGSAGDASNVPEPVAGLLLGIGICLLICGWRCSTRGTHAAQTATHRVSCTRRFSGCLLTGTLMLATTIFGAMQRCAFGANKYWDRNGTTSGAGTTGLSGTWSTSMPHTNWSANFDGTGARTVWADANDYAFFSAGTDATGAFTVTVDGTQTTRGLNIEEGTITFSNGTVNVVEVSSINVAAAIVDGANSALTTDELWVGNTSTGSLTVQNGGHVTATGDLVSIGRINVATGTMLVTGSGSTFTMTDTDSELAIGDDANGTGTLTVANNGLVDIADLTTIGADGQLNLQGGTFSTRHFTHTLGGTLDFDEGVLEIDGGTFNNGVTNFEFQGNASGKTVTFRLKGSSATGASNELRVGRFGNIGSGRFELLSGADFTSGLTRIALDANSSGSALVDGAGSVWTTGEMRLGENGVGSLTLQNGGDVTSGLVRIGLFENGSGSALVDGTGSVWSAGIIRVGESGVGSLTVQNGGDVNVTATNVTSVEVGDNATATGTLLVTGSGSTLTTATGGDLNIGGNGSTGTVTVANGGLVDIADNTTIGSVGRLNLRGGTFRTGSFTHTLGGTLDFEDGLFEVDGGTFNNGVTNFAFQGNAAGKTVTFRLVNGATGTSDDLEVGQLGNLGAGAFELKSGSKFTSDLARIARNGGSQGSALVDGAGSVWTTAAMRLGESGVGSLTVQNGGDVNVTNTNATSVTVGHNATATSTLLVTGSGSTFTTATGGDMVIGNNGSTGTVTVANGGLVDIADVTTIGAVGRLNLQGGTLSTRSFTHTLGGTLAFDDGTLEIDGGTFNNGVSIFSFQGNASGKTVTFRLTNAATGASGELRVGNTGPFGSGRFELLNGSTFSSTLARIATQANSSGSALVDAGSAWTTGALRVGEGGGGSLTVQNGGDIVVTNTNQTSVRVGDDIPAATGTLLVTGTGSTLTTATGGDMVIGNNGSTGTVTVANGGLVDIANLTTIGAVGRLNLQGGTLSTRSFTHTLGGTLDFDGGTLEIDGGTFNNGGTNFVYQGNASGKTVTFRLTNGANGAAANFEVGQLGGVGSGRFELVSGADFTATGLTRIGRNGGSNGSVLVDGAGAVWTSASILVSDSGTGSVTVQNGGTINSSNNVDIGRSGVGTGTVTGNGSTWSVTGITRIGRNASGNGSLLIDGTGAQFHAIGDLIVGDAGTGLLTVKNGGLVTASNSLQVGAKGTIKGNGTFNANVTNGGRIAPGNSPGIMTINGNYTQAAGGVLEIEVASFTGPTWIPGTDHDQLQVTGTAALAGRLEIPIIDPLKSAGGPTIGLPPIDFLTANSVTGEFSAVVAPGLNPNLAVDVEYIKSGLNQGARLSFVPIKTNVVFDDATNTTADWFNNTTTWEDTANPGSPVLPTLVHDISIQNLTGTAQEVEVEAGNAFVARLTVGGGSQDLTVQIGDGTTSPLNGNLSSTIDVKVVNNGVIELNAGTLATSTVMVESGGLVQGNGLIDLSNQSSGTTGKLTVNDGTLSPGFLVGHLDVDGNYQQSAAGTMLIDVEGSGANEADTVDVTGNVTLGGTLIFDASQLGPDPAGPTVFPILTAGSRTGIFGNVVTTGNDDIYVRLIYDYQLHGIGVSAQVCDFGNLDCDDDQAIDDDDVRAFAAALRDLNAYMEQYQVWTDSAADFDRNGRVDFDDIDDFVELASLNGSGITMQMVLNAFESYGKVPEPTSAGILVGGVCLLAGHYRRRMPS